MKVTYKITLETEVPNMIVNAILEEEHEKMTTIKKFLELEMCQNVKGIFKKTKVNNCKIKVSFGKDDKVD